MPRNMSFMLTTEQFQARTKTVTRRLGWKFLKPGDILNGCRRCQGLKKGEKIQKLGQIRITDVHRECLKLITQEDCILEGFSGLTPAEFVVMFCRHMKAHRETIVTRIEFEYI